MNGSHPTSTKVDHDAGLRMDKGDRAGASREPIQRSRVLVVLGYHCLVSGNGHPVANMVSLDEFEGEWINGPAVVLWRGAGELNSDVRLLGETVDLAPSTYHTLHLLAELAVANLHPLQGFQVHANLHSLTDHEGSSRVQWFTQDWQMRWKYGTTAGGGHTSDIYLSFVSQTVQIFFLSRPNDTSYAVARLVIPVGDIFDPALTAETSILVAPVPVPASDHHGAAEDTRQPLLSAGGARRDTNPSAGGILDIGLYIF